jgi:flagellar biosynthesis anti-sigma factor FlgM
MRIESYQSQPVSALPPASRSQATTRTQAASSALSLSPTGSLVMAARQALRDLPAVRETQVRQVSNDLSRGRYAVDSQQIARAMVGAEGAAAGE